MKTGINILNRIEVHHKGTATEHTSTSPAPKLNRLGRLGLAKATQNELRGEAVFVGQAQMRDAHNRRRIIKLPYRRARFYSSIKKQLKFKDMVAELARNALDAVAWLHLNRQ